MYKVPLAQPDVGELERNLLIDAFDNKHFTTGKIVKQFEDELAKFIGVKHVIVVNSGSSALLLAWDALLSLNSFNTSIDVKIPALNYISDVAVLHKLDIPYRMVDVDEESNYPVHVMGVPYGNPRDVLVEDCCESLGTKGTGKLGLVSTHSFFTSHIITTGEGGACATNNDEVADRIRSMRAFGRDFTSVPYKPYDFPVAGYSMKLTDLQAAIGVGQMAHIHENLASRRRIADRLYNDVDWNDIRYPAYVYDEGIVNFGFPIYSSSPWSDVAYLEERGIETRPLLCYLPEQKFCKTDTDYPHAHAIHDHSYFIGCHQTYTDEQVDYLVEVLGELNND